MDDDKDVQDEIADSEDVGEVGSGFSAVKELKKTSHFEKPVESKFGIVVTHF